MTDRLSIEQCQRVSIQQLSLGDDAYSLEFNDQVIKLVRTKCNYGGYRVWFLCPTCNYRVGTLYCKPLASEFLCRHCNNLTYQLRKYHRSANEEFLKAIHRLKPLENRNNGVSAESK